MNIFFSIRRAASTAAALVALTLLLTFNTGCAILRPQPLDLHTAHERLVEYHETGDYIADVARAARPAIPYLEKRHARAAANEKLAVVFDIDETTLSNWPQLFAEEFCYDPATWNKWVMQAEAEPIEPLLTVYERARALGYAVFFITGRRESQREATDANLRATGYTEFEELVLKPENMNNAKAADYKTPVRARIEGQGWTIALNIGDQQSDLDGGHAEKTIKLPNPYYYIK